MQRGVGFEEFGKPTGLVGRNAGDEVGREIDHHNGVGALDQLQDVVGDVARMRAKCVCRAMAEQDWSRTAVELTRPASEDVEHGVFADV